MTAHYTRPQSPVCRLYCMINCLVLRHSAVIGKLNTEYDHDNITQCITENNINSVLTAVTSLKTNITIQISSNSTQKDADVSTAIL